MTVPSRPAPDPTTVADLVDRETGSAISRPGWAQYTSFTLFSEPGIVVGPNAPASIDQLDTMLGSDGTAGKLERVLTQPLRGATWSIEPSAGDTGECDVIRALLTRPANAGGMSIGLSTVLGQMAATVYQRQSTHEKVFTTVEVDGVTRIGLDKIALRPKRTTWVLRDPALGTFQGFAQRIPKIVNGASQGTQVVTVPAARALVHVHGQHREPLDGVGDLDLTYRLWDAKRKVVFLWSKYLEHQAFGRIVVTAGDGLGQDVALQELATTVAGTKGGGVAALPYGAGATLLAGSAAAEFLTMLNWINDEMSGSLLAGFTNLANSGRTGSAGSYALSRDHSDLFTQGRDADLVEIAATVNNYLIADLVRWNFGPDASVPVFAFAPLAESDSGQILTLLQSLAAIPAGSPTILPAEFINEVVDKAATVLDLDTVKVHEALMSSVDTTQPRGAQASQLVNNAVQMVAAHTAATAQAQAGAAA